jgi:hypothetical protein
MGRLLFYAGLDSAGPVSHLRSGSGSAQVRESLHLPDRLGVHRRRCGKYRGIVKKRASQLTILQKLDCNMLSPLPDPMGPRDKAAR